MDLERSNNLVWGGIIEKFHFNSSELQEMSEWVMRVYFGESSKNKPWYSPTATVENVLQEFLKAKSPITPVQLADMWRSKESIKNVLGKADLENDLEAVQAYLNRSVKETTYQKGGLVFDELAQELDLAAFTVRRDYHIAIKKLKKLAGKRKLDDYHQSEMDMILEGMGDIQKQIAGRMATALKVSGGVIETFLKELENVGYATKKVKEDVLCSPQQVEAFEVLATFKRESIELILITDMEEEGGMFPLFQRIVSKTIAPPAKVKKKKLSLSPATEDNGEEDEEGVEELEDESSLIEIPSPMPT